MTSSFNLRAIQLSEQLVVRTSGGIYYLRPEIIARFLENICDAKMVWALVLPSEQHVSILGIAPETMNRKDKILTSSKHAHEQRGTVGPKCARIAIDELIEALLD